MRARVVCWCLSLIAISFSVNVWAKDWAGGVSQSAVVGPNEAGEVRVGLEFDLGSFPAASNIEIDGAVIEWSIIAPGAIDGLNVSLLQVPATWQPSAAASALWAASIGQGELIGWDV